jgi:uroporphyrinogen-III synthase
MSEPDAVRVWITRAEPGASRTASRLRDLGLEPIVGPLLEIESLDPLLPDLDAFAALAFTSVNGVDAFAALTPRRDPLVFAVGDATAQAARDVGFVAVRSAAGDLAALARLLASDLRCGAVLAPQAATPAGDFAAALTAAGAKGLDVHTLAVYRARPAVAAPPPAFDAVLVHSPRAGLGLAALGRHALAHAVIACISPAAAAPLAAVGLAPIAALHPDENALIATLQAALGKRRPPV